MKFSIPKLKKDTASSDVKKLEAAVKGVKGVTNVTMDAPGSSIDISYGTDVKVAALKDAAKSAGFEMHDKKA